MGQDQIYTLKEEQRNFQKKILSLSKSLNTLKEIHADYVNEPNKKILQMALAKSFELSFELSWKTLQSFFKSQGELGVESPKNLIKEAFNKEVIQDGQLWIDMLISRNSLSHIYDEGMLKRIIENISKEYLDEIDKLYEKLKREV